MINQFVNVHRTLILSLNRFTNLTIKEKHIRLPHYIRLQPFDEHTSINSFNYCPVAQICHVGESNNSGNYIL